MRHTLDPKLDVVFKLLFAQPQNRELLVSLLTAVLQPATPIVEVSVLNPEVPRMVARDKGAVLDLLVRLGDGSLVDVEMQTRSRPGLRARAAYYWARMLASELRRGQDYERPRKTVLVLLLGQRELRTERFHCIFQLREVREHELLTELCEIHTVELPKLGGVAAEGEEGALVR
ncbi:MAG: Rpn family recombination-promoting nuclease/putative transposase, partial [Deltaproteobacteria bacterium]|nr:Rpn family recombination-promoting nuclease/putative transposase [Deltaproteobacteria bacterium]